MITLYGFKPAWGMPDVSPFVIKVDAYLRFAKIPYQIKPGSLRKSPFHKLPTINDQGKIIGDSSLIIQYLMENYEFQPDIHLTEAQKHLSLVLKRLLEESMYWIEVYQRYVADEAWTITREGYLSHLTGLNKLLIPKVYRKYVLKQLWKQGYGRLPVETVIGLMQQNMDALSFYLGNKPYFNGEEVTSFDASAFGFIAGMLMPPIPGPIREAALKYPTLSQYCERILKRYY